MLNILMELDDHCHDLSELLIDSVNSGASVGFVPPLSEGEAIYYWKDIAVQIHSSDRLLLVAWEGEKIAGAVQLALCSKKNARHRAEIEKLLVHTTYRRRGVGELLMQRIEQIASDLGRTLLVLDTRCEDLASMLYRKRGFIEVGRIPDYALGASGKLEGTSYFYKKTS